MIIYNPVDFGGDAIVRGVIDGAVEIRDLLASLGHQVKMLRVDRGVRPLVEGLDELSPDVVFNLCEGYREWTGGEFCIAGLLELLGIPYTGSSAIALGVGLNKPLCKEIFIARDIPTPRFAVYRELPAAPPPLRFPMILKLAGEDASIGITPGNVVHDAPAFLKRLKEMLDEYRSPVLVEEFINGREFTVALRDGTPLLVEEIEIHVEPRIVGFRAKWVAGTEEYRGTTAVFSPAITERERAEMMTLAARVWDATGVRDYARVDFRMDEDGKIYVLEVNPNPDISAGSGYRRTLETVGVSFADFLTGLLENAVGRGSRVG